MNTGEIIKFLRKRDNLTQQALADMLGVKKSSVQKYESGSVQNLKLETIQRLCEIFCVTPIAFVFPEALEVQPQLPQTNRHDFSKFATIYLTLTDEAKEKALQYVEDLSQVKRYVRPELHQYKDIQELLRHLKGGK